MILWSVLNIWTPSRKLKNNKVHTILNNLHFMMSHFILIIMNHSIIPY